HVAVAALRARVQLDAYQAQSVDTDTDGAFGIAGLELGDEALPPQLAIRARVGRSACGFVTEVTVEIHVAQLEARLAVFDQSSLGYGRDGHGGSEDAEGQFRALRGPDHCFSVSTGTCSIIRSFTRQVGSL